MAIYTKITDFAAKDSLTTGDPLKRARGTEVDVEFDNIATAIETLNTSKAVTAGSSTQAFSATTAAEGTNTTQVATTAFVQAAVGIGFKNKIIGGDFTINPWQRGTSFPAIASNVYFADRWAVGYATTAVTTASKVADSPTAAQAGIFTQHCISIAVTTADTSIAASDLYILRQFIEGLTVAPFGFGQAGSRNVTLSFWVKGTKTGIHCVGFTNGAQGRSYVAEYTIVATNTWEYKTITIPVDTAGTWRYDTGVGLDLCFSLMAGTTFQTTANTWAAGNFIATANQVNALDSTANVFNIALVQLEAGSVATKFDVRSVGHELSLCQRYYEIIYGVLHAAQYYTPWAFKQTKRATPTFVALSATNGGTLNPGTVHGTYQETNASSAIAASFSATSEL